MDFKQTILFCSNLFLIGSLDEAFFLVNIRPFLEGVLK
jgi:hypothetical protein